MLGPGTILMSGYRPSPEELATLQAAAEAEGVQFVLGDDQAPDALPGESWSSYILRCRPDLEVPRMFIPKNPTRPSRAPIPAQMLRKRHR